MSKLIQVSQLHATPDGPYINGEVRVMLYNPVAPKKPTAPWKATLTDSTGSIEASIWGGDPSHWAGKSIVLTGKGMKVQDYQGKKSLSVGDKVSISFGGAPGTAAQEPSHPDLEAATPQTSRTVAPNQPQTQTPRSGQIKPFPALPDPFRDPLPINLPHPACVGACVNKAVEVWIATIGKDQPWGDSSADTVQRIAAELILVHQTLEKGVESNEPF